MKIRIHRVNILKGKGQFTSWLIGSLVNWFENTDFSHAYVEIIDENNKSFSIDNLIGFYVKSINSFEDTKNLYAEVGIWEKELSKKEYTDCINLFKSYIGMYYSPWKIITFPIRRWLGIPGNLSGTICPEIIVHFFNLLGCKQSIPELTGMSELSSLLGDGWSNFLENTNSR